ncbi:MAG: Do family serine endopeptidase, partial [Microvirga sp.]|nr:Do family serine endopeptidase [Microvirga sp.]
MDHTMDVPASSRAKSRRPSRFRAAASCLAVVTLLATSVPMVAQARSAPESFADLAEEVTGAVVNISASTTVEARNRTLPQLPPGTPFEDLFEEFFNRRGGQGNGGSDSAPQRQRRSNSLG